MSDRWQPIKTAPTDGKQILTGFQGQFDWRYFIDPAHGDDTGINQPHARPTHLVPVTPSTGLCGVHGLTPACGALPRGVY